MMEKIKIAFQGEMGAYSHIACEEIFPGSSIRACPTFEETFKIAYDDENYKIVCLGAVYIAWLDGKSYF